MFNYRQRIVENTVNRKLYASIEQFIELNTLYWHILICLFNLSKKYDG